LKDLNELKQAIQKYPHRNIPKHELLEQLDGLVANAKTPSQITAWMFNEYKERKETKWILAVGSEEDKP
jgi:hypothetical protein